MPSLARLLGLAGLAGAPWSAAATYGQPPCGPNEIQGEVQGASGYLCAPRCTEDSYNCPTEVPGGASAQPQCMLQDINRNALCGLLCQVDAQCPSGAQCRQLRQVEVGICLYPISFADWAHQSGSTQKLAVGWPSRPAGQQGSGQSAGPAGFQIAKTYVALQSLKSKYSIDDGDADMLVLKELLGSLQAPGSSATATLGQTSATLSANPVAPVAAAPQAVAAAGGTPAWGLSHDVSQFEKYVGRGIPGLEQELHDTVWNIEHIEHRFAATHLLTGIIWVGLLYLGVGGFFKYQQGARGADLIPHVAFWAEYPRLVADGVTYSKILLGMQLSADMGGLTGGVTTIGNSRPSGGAGSFDPL